MDREKYLKDTGGIQRIRTIELLDEIERLTEVDKARHVLAKARGKSIKQLKKEKEWLINDLSYAYRDRVAPSIMLEKAKEIIIEEMQQALRERK